MASQKPQSSRILSAAGSEITPAKKVSSCTPCVGSSVGSGSIMMWRTPRPSRRRWRSIPHCASALAHPVQIRSPHRILKPRQCRLRSQSRPIDRLTADKELLGRGLGQSRGIVAVRIPAGDRVQALAHQIPDRVFDLARLPSAYDAAPQALRQTQSLVAGLQQNRPTVATAVSLVEPCIAHLRKPSREVARVTE
jgi:hypothetical protein